MNSIEKNFNMQFSRIGCHLINLGSATEQNMSLNYPIEHNMESDNVEFNNFFRDFDSYTAQNIFKTAILRKAVNNISLTYFNAQYNGQVEFSRKIDLCEAAGCYSVSKNKIIINTSIFDYCDNGMAVFIEVIKNLLCHYHLINNGLISVENYNEHYDNLLNKINGVHYVGHNQIVNPLIVYSMLPLQKMLDKILKKRLERFEKENFICKLKTNIYY